MLVSAQISNFRTCKNLSLKDLQPVLVLVGRNGVGKTNILNAISWCAKMAVATSAGEIDQESSGEVSLSVQLGIFRFSYAISTGMDGSIGRQEQWIRESLFVQRAKQDLVEPIFTRDDAGLVSLGDGTKMRLLPSAPTMSSFVALHPTNPYIKQVVGLMKFFKGFEYYPLDHGDNSEDVWILAEDEYKEWKAGKSKALKSDRLLMLKLLSLWLEKHSKFEELEALVGPAGLGLVQTIRVTSLDFPSSEDSTSIQRKLYLIRFNPANHARASDFAFSQLSFGTKRVLRLVISLLYDDSTIALIEQPEDGIHAGLLSKLIPLIRNNKSAGQFMFTTHSPTVINRVKPEEVRLVEINEGITTLRALSQKEVSAACFYMEEEGAFSDFLTSIQD